MVYFDRKHDLYTCMNAGSQNKHRDSPRLLELTSCCPASADLALGEAFENGGSVLLSEVQMIIIIIIIVFAPVLMTKHGIFGTASAGHTIMMMSMPCNQYYHQPFCCYACA